MNLKSLKNVVLLASVFIITGLVSCNTDTSAQLLKKWQYKDVKLMGQSTDLYKDDVPTLQFNGDGTFISAVGEVSKQGTWVREDKKLTFTDDEGKSHVMYIDSIEKDVLVLRAENKELEEDPVFILVPAEK